MWPHPQARFEAFFPIAIQQLAFDVRHLKLQSAAFDFVSNRKKNFKMSRRKVFHTAEEVLEYMFSKEIESDIIALPPDVDELTDEEYFDDDEMTTPSVKDLSGNVEMCVPMEKIEVKEQYESIDINDDDPNSTEQLPSSASNETKNKKWVDSELPKKNA
ncbi:UNVERIFIED_CONTAM: hypothetical protein NCL1_20558 [Trichonephila clavipes]